jgi:hypothetical protein
VNRTRTIILTLIALVLAVSAGISLVSCGSSSRAPDTTQPPVTTTTTSGPSTTAAPATTTTTRAATTTTSGGATTTTTTNPPSTTVPVTTTTIAPVTTSTTIAPVTTTTSTTTTSTTTTTLITFSLETIDDGGGTNYVGRYNSLAVDSGGHLYISYYDLTGQKLKAANNLLVNWITFEVDSSGNVGQHNRVKAESGGTTHIVYMDTTNGKIKYASINTSGTVTTVEVIDNAPSSAPGLCINGSALVTAYRNDNSVYVASRPLAGTGWTIDGHISDTNQNSYSAVDMAADGAGVLHVAYDSQAGQELKYTKYTGGVWLTPSVTVEAADSFGHYIALVCDSNNKAQMIYDHWNSPWAVKYASQEASGWSTQSINNNGIFDLDLCLDSSTNRLHAAYSNGGNLQYATKLIGEPSWLVYTVDNTLTAPGSYGFSPSIVFYGEKVYISYYAYKGSSGVLNLATQN